MNPRNIILIGIAVFIDGLQALFSLAFFVLGSTMQAATPVGAGLGCGVAGAAANGVVTGITAGIACALASPFGIALGVGLGYATDVCISITLGGGFILLLMYFDMYYPMRIFGMSILELIPGLDNLPGWTVMTVLCIVRKTAEERKLAGKTASGVFANLLSSNTAIGGAFKAVQSVNRARISRTKEAGAATESQEQEAVATSEQRLKANLKNVDGITTAPPHSPAGVRARTRYAA